MGSINYGLSSIAPTANNIGCLSYQNTTIYFICLGFADVTVVYTGRNLVKATVGQFGG